VLLEAAAAERPIIATDVGGTAELLTHERSALLIPAESREAISAAMVRLYHDPALRVRLAAAAREEVVTRFSIEQASRSLADFWRKAMTKS
jgi:glycosyltransferase involved in cell wall biosynthesis